MNAIYRIGPVPETKSIIEIYQSSGINRPTADTQRIAKMYQHSNLVVTAWHDEKLIGIARSLTDYSYCCYLSDLAVRKEYQQQGIGKELIALTQQAIGPQAMLLLLSAPAALEYYPKLGFEAVDNGFIIKRTQ